MKYIENIKGTNQHKIQNEKGFIIINADSKEQAIEIYNANYTPVHDKKRELLAKVKSNASNLLEKTDYKVLRHLGQKELSSKGKIAKTKLSDKQYEDLELEREAIRKWSNDKEVEINNASTIEELEQIGVEYQ